MYSRISPGLSVQQSYDQHAFARDVRVEDVLLVVENIIEYVLEFDSPVWMMSMDMRKIFDTIEYESLLNVFAAHGVAQEYIILLQQPNSMQIGSVEDSEFNIKLGVKQGDVLSSILFNCTLDLAFE